MGNGSTWVGAAGDFSRLAVELQGVVAHQAGAYVAVFLMGHLGTLSPGQAAPYVQLMLDRLPPPVAASQAAPATR